MTRPETATLREFADLIRCKPGYVTELRKAGRLVMTDDATRVRVVESIALIEATRDPARAGVVERHAERRGEALASAPAEDYESDDVEVVAATPDARRRAKALADKAEADAAAAIRANLIADGKLYDADDADRAVATAITLLRKALERLPTTLAPQLAVIDDEARARDIIAAEIEQMQRDLDREFRAVGRAPA